MFEKVGNGNTREQNKQKLKTNKQTKTPVIMSPYWLLILPESTKTPFLSA